MVRNPTIIIRPYAFLHVPGRTSWFGISFHHARMRSMPTPEGLSWIGDKSIYWGETRQEAIEHVCEAITEPKHEYHCQGCGREESVCSADPCPGVIADRGD